MPTCIYLFVLRCVQAVVLYIILVTLSLVILVHSYYFSFVYLCVVSKQNLYSPIEKAHLVAFN